MHTEPPSSSSSAATNAGSSTVLRSEVPSGDPGDLLVDVDHQALGSHDDELLGVGRGVEPVHRLHRSRRSRWRRGTTGRPGARRCRPTRVEGARARSVVCRRRPPGGCPAPAGSPPRRTQRSRSPPPRSSGPWCRSCRIHRRRTRSTLRPWPRDRPATATARTVAPTCVCADCSSGLPAPARPGVHCRSRSPGRRRVSRLRGRSRPAVQRRCSSCGRWPISPERPLAQPVDTPDRGQGERRLPCRRPLTERGVAQLRSTRVGRADSVLVPVPSWPPVLSTRAGTTPSRRATRAHVFGTAGVDRRGGEGADDRGHGAVSGCRRSELPWPEPARSG